METNGTGVKPGTDIYWLWDGENPLAEVEHSDEGIKFEWIIDEPYYKEPVEKATVDFLMGGGQYEGEDDAGQKIIRALSEFTWSGRKYELEYQEPFEGNWDAIIAETAEKD